MLVSICISQGNNRFTRHQVCGRSETDDGKSSGGVNFDQCEVGRPVKRDQCANVRGLVPECHIDAGHAGNDVVMLFDPADHTHLHWRKAAVEELAREAAPCRVNGAVGGSSGDMKALCEYLDNAPGVTGQLFRMDGNPGQKD